MRSSLAVEVFFIVKSESKRSPGANFEQRENIPILSMSDARSPAVVPATKLLRLSLGLIHDSRPNIQNQSSAWLCTINHGQLSRETQWPWKIRECETESIV